MFLNIFRLICLGFPTVLYEITDYLTKKLFKTQSASFGEELFCQNREIGAKNKYHTVVMPINSQN